MTLDSGSCARFGSSALIAAASLLAASGAQQRSSIFITRAG